MLHHSPVRRSPRLQGESVMSILSDQPQPVSSAASGTNVTTQAKDVNKSGQTLPSTSQIQTQPASNTEPTKASGSQQIPLLPKSATSSSRAIIQAQTPPNASAVSMQEMQKQIAMLQRQLSDTQVKLCDSNRQCQELQSAIQKKDQVSDLNLNYVSVSQPTVSAIDQIPPTTYPLQYGSQPTNTSTTYAATIPCMQTAASSVPMPSTQAAQTSNNFLSLPMFNDTNLPFAQTAPTLNPLYVSPAANNLTQSFWQTNQQQASSSNNVFPRKVQDLPDFSGEPEDWPLFYTAFTQSTAAYGYTNLENNQRLHKCLKGAAREVIKSLLIHPDNVNAVIEQLKFRFGRPEQLIHSQLKQVRELPHVNENNIVKLVPFSTKVKNLAVFLQSVNGQQHIANPTLLEELVTKLPMSKKLDWAKVAAGIKPYPTIIDFSNWLSEIANLICTIEEVEQKEQKRRVLLHTTINQCILCKGPHKIYDCVQFLNMQVQDRWKQIKKFHACFSCLNVGHTTRDCRRKKQCLKNGCQRRHNKLLHEDQTSEPLSVQPLATNEHQQNVLSCRTENNNKVLFKVLPVTLYGENCRMDVFALFDEGSSITLLDKNAADIIGVRGKNSSLNIQWISGRSAHESAISFNVKVSGIDRKGSHLLKNVYAVSNLNLPMQSLTKEEIKKAFKDSSRLPVKPYTNIVPKLLIGLDHAFLGLPSSTNNSNLKGPFACNTELGWVVFGPCGSISSAIQSCLFVDVKRDDELHKIVTDYFNIESLGVRAAPSVESEEDVRAKQILNETTKRIGNRFQTGLLWKNDEVRFPDSYPMAVKRLEGIERKMQRDPQFAKSYKEIMKRYLDKGYIRKLSPRDIKVTSSKKWYLPHFGVINPNKPNKLRLVFDAAASINGISLNSQLLKGPQDIASLPSTLYNFRRGQIAVGADIREMFHQILVQPCDRISQRLLWRDGNTEKQPDEYEMVVMTFGAACSPCSALFVMKLNAREHSSFNPRAIKAICDHHYMDDFVDSFNSVEEAISISNQVREIHKNGGFELRGFISNSTEVTTTLDGNLTSKQIPASDGTEKVLGLFWEPSSDKFMFNLKFHRVDQSVMSGKRSPTKREILSIIMSTFDPLGYLNNFTVGGKLLLREIWRTNCLWDEPIPKNLNSVWERWRSQLLGVVNFRVTRFYFSAGKPVSLQLHIFVDASEEAFAAVAYWRYLCDSGNIFTSFIASKTKCSPLKRVTTPRLELQAAVLGARLKQNILSEHSLVPHKCTLWGDSKTVLKWISSSHRKYKPYVAHRVAEILSSTEVEDWKWISTKDNVADEATRACIKVDFSPSSRWLNGPPFLTTPEESWAVNVFEILDEEDDKEEIYQKVSLLIANNNIIDFLKFSSLLRLKRVTAWVLRFINHCRKKYNNLQIHGLTSSELENAERLLCLQAQNEVFQDELKLIKNKKPVPKNSSLFTLSPFVDDDGLLKVYGRIDSASCLPYSSRRPVILPKNHRFTTLIVMYHHCRMKHQNHEATVCEIRKRFWIPHLRTLLKKVVSNCQLCRIKNSIPRAPFMGPLPSDRLEPNVEPFKYTGLDYFGPINVSIGRRTEKRWVALFTCLTIRAIHLELAYDLSTDSCIIAMRNFMNRRGVPTRIRSDNGKNFIGANEEAKRFSEVFDAEKIQNEMAMKGIEWVFNCPANPSEGGVWERMVQCVKRVLRHTLKEISPKEHVLHSLLIEAENIVNSRPLTHLPISPQEEEPLTPNHFLIGRGNIACTPSVESPDVKPFSMKKQWRVSRCLRDRFWKKWVNEYLPTLTRRVKWCERTDPIKAGDLAFICDPNIPRSQWRRGLVTCVHTGSDGVARRADVKTSSGNLQRAVSRLAVLDVEGGEADRSTGVGVFRNVFV